MIKSEKYSLSTMKIISIIISTFCFILLLSSGGVRADRTKSKIYEPIDGSYPCFRKLNGTHQVGCGSGLNGEVGVVYLVDNTNTSLQWVIKDGPHDPYIALIYPDFMTSDVMHQFKNSDRIAGVLVLNSTSRIQKLNNFSTDSTCPNQGFGLYSNPTQSQHYCEKWNDAGQGILFERFDFPIFYVKNETEADSILECYYKFNHPIDDGNKTTPRDWPFCAAQLKAFMLAAVDTPTCIRRSQKFNLEPNKARVCDRMEDHNIWASLIPSNQSEPYKKENGSVIVISARLDAASMFEGLAHGADSAGTGIATFLAVLQHLSDNKNFTDFLKNSPLIDNVYFFLFHGEAFGYIGSSRMVYDMKNGFPSGIKNDTQNSTALLNITDIKYYIEIGQVGLTNDAAPYFIHTTNDSVATFQLSDMLVQKGNESKLTMHLATQTQLHGFPPSSLQSFIKERPSIPGVFISNHDFEFRNKFYNSMFDDETQLQYRHRDNSSIPTNKIAKLAAAIANTVMGLAGFDVSQSNASMNFTNTDDLMHCYVESANCDLFQVVSGTDKLQPMDRYVGVNRYEQAISFGTHLTRLIMMYFQGVNVTSIRKEDECKTPKNILNAQYQWINGSCLETTVDISHALSPAFVIDNYDWSSGKYSTWSESVWQEFSVRIFLKPSRTHEIVTLVCGILVFLISFVIVGWFSSKSDIIFPTRPANGIAC